MINMRRYNLLVFLTLMTVAAQAQFMNLGATVTIQSGATLRVETNIENNGAPWQYNQMDRLNWANEE